MIYRNGWREFFILAVSFGAPMSVFFIIQYGFVAGAIGGVSAGLLFGGAMTLFTRGTEKKFAKMRAEIAADRRIICDGGATWQGIGGWMFFTAAGLEFYPHKFNHARKEFAIPLAQLSEVRLKRNLLVIVLKDGTGLEVVVSKSKEWKKQIDTVLAQGDWGGYSI
jgi:hypothetical protein